MQSGKPPTLIMFLSRVVTYTETTKGSPMDGGVVTRRIPSAVTDPFRRPPGTSLWHFTLSYRHSCGQNSLTTGGENSTVRGKCRGGGGIDPWGFSPWPQYSWNVILQMTYTNTVTFDSFLRGTVKWNKVHSLTWNTKRKDYSQKCGTWMSAGRDVNISLRFTWRRC